MQHTLKRPVLALLLMTTALSLAACGGPERRGPDRREAGMYIDGLSGGQIVRPGPSANEAYSAGMDLKNGGDCKGAIEKLRPVANLGPGYENAQFALGDCLLPPKNEYGSDKYFESLMWLTRSADGGWSEAQGKLAQVYALGPANHLNLDEAAFWFALYRANASTARVGFTPMSADFEAATANAIGVERLKAAEPRVAKWQRKAWIPPARPDGQPGPEMRGARKRGGPQM